MQKYRCYFIDYFGNSDEAFVMEEESGDWCRSEDVDAELARLKAQIQSLESDRDSSLDMVRDIRADADLLKAALRWCAINGISNVPPPHIAAVIAEAVKP